MCHPSRDDLELDYLRHLLACLVFELEDLEIGSDQQLDDNTVICVRSLIHLAPESVMKLVGYLHDHPEDRQQGEAYTYAFPFMRWWKPGAAIPPEDYLIPPCRQRLRGQRE